MTIWKRHWGKMIAAVMVLAIAVFLLTEPGKGMVAWTEAILADCPGTTVHASMVDTFLVIGHRGAAAKEVENTIASFERAVADGANGIELDLCMTSDSVVVVWHDWDPNDAIAKGRESGTEPDVRARPLFPEDTDYRRAIHTLTLAEFRQHYGYAEKDDEVKLPVMIPTFEEAIQWIALRPTIRYLFLDIKAREEDSAMAVAMIARIEKMIAEASPTCTIVYLSPHQNIYQIIRQLAPTHGVSYDVVPPGGIVIDPCENASAIVAERNGESYASLVHPVTSTLAPWTTLKRMAACDVALRDAHNKRGGAPSIEKVIVSTINDPEKIECLRGIGVDGLITDDPALLKKMGL